MAESTKDIILGRIHQALANAPEPPTVARTYRQTDDRDRQTILNELVDRLEDYKARVERVQAGDLAAAIAQACAAYHMQTLVAPTDIPPEWLPADVTTLRDDPLLPLAQLDGSDGVLTACELAIAQTGTIVLDGGAQQGRRALSLVPDRHLCVVFASQVVAIVPEGIARLMAHPERPQTFISGPSATSDIELSRVEGVHGPRTLHVFLVDDR